MNAYSKLRPWTEIESCKCEIVTGLFLIDLLTDNPIHCASCRREVDPERLMLSIDETESIAKWFSSTKALYRLWLNSGEYELYAKARLLDPKGQINIEGIAIAQSLSIKYPTLLWFFHDTDDGEPTNCPICLQLLDANVEWGTGKCMNCRIQI
jgi:hypothetical protein